MGRSLVVAFLALVGLLCAAGMGYAAYVVSRDSVAVPVTRLQQTPAAAADPGPRPSEGTGADALTPDSTRRPPRPAPTTTVDDHGGRSRGGSGGSGRGGGGHGGDD